MNEKTCSKCKSILPISEFTVGKYRCKACCRADVQEYRIKNKEKINSVRREQYAANIESVREKQKEYRDAHSEEQSEKWKRWYEKNKEKRAEYQRQYRKDNVEYFREKENARYAKDPHVSARRLIQQRVAKGTMPKASDLLCRDCGVQAEEYDHYLGYIGPARSMVDPVCKDCHNRRGQERMEAKS